MPSSSISKKIEVIDTPATPRKSSSTHRHRVLQVVADRISQDADALSLASAVSELYVGELQRILQIGTNLDRPRQLQRAHDSGWKQSARAARFALRDELEYFRLFDRACRGLCDCLGIRTRILFETIANKNARNNPLSPEELRRHNPGDLMMNMMLQKAITYGLSVPDELMRIGSEEELKEFVDNFGKEGGSQA